MKKALQRALDLSELVSTVIKDDATKRQKNEKPPGFALTITEEILGSETGINELVGFYGTLFLITSFFINNNVIYKYDVTPLKMTPFFLIKRRFLKIYLQVAPCTSAQKTTTAKYQPSVIVNVKKTF